MKTSKLLLGTLLLAALTMGAGLLHGHMRNRWDTPQQLDTAVERLQQLSESKIGDWSLLDKKELRPGDIKMLECAGYHSRTYVNEQTGDSVHVVVLLGPHGPTSLHIPEICYSSRDFDQLGQRTPVTFGEPADAADQLWQLTFKSRDIDASRLSVYYGWSTGQEWEATRYPRFAFIGQPYLYKIQVAANILGNEGQGSPPDPALAFLEDFLPTLRDHLQSAR